MRAGVTPAHTRPRDILGPKHNAPIGDAAVLKDARRTAAKAKPVRSGSRRRKTPRTLDPAVVAMAAVPPVQPGARSEPEVEEAHNSVVVDVTWEPYRGFAHGMESKVAKLRKPQPPAVSEPSSVW